MTKTKKTTKEENYHLTPLGLLESVLGPDAAREAADALALYMIRLAEPGCFVGIVVQRGALEFVQVAEGGEE
jgi:hypothetical protein